MGKSRNIDFMQKYMLLEKEANELMGVKHGGVSAYIAALEEKNGAPGVKEALKMLKKCRHVRNCLAHDPGALKTNDEITRIDVAFIKSLTGDIKRQKDPLSKAMNKRAKSSGVKPVFAASLIIAVAAAVGAVILFT